MLTLFKKIIHRSINSLGFEIMFIKNIQGALECRDKKRKFMYLEWMKNIGITHVLDIGANTGQFAQEIHELLPSAIIHSFEPVPQVFEELEKNLETIPGAKAYNLGIGADDGQLSIYVNEFSPTTSLLSMTPQQKSEFGHRFPEITKMGYELVVEVKRLDNIATEINLSSPYLIKVDTEGYELNVIMGGSKVIRNADVVIMETSFYELYKGQALFSEVHDAMNDLGFYYAGAFGVNLSPRDGLILQQDSIFLPHRYARDRKGFPDDSNQLVNDEGVRP